MTHKTDSTSPARLPADISQLRRMLRQIHEQQLELLQTMMSCGPMIAGSVYQTWRTCSYRNCRCHKGQKHGPFPAISFTTAEGKRRSRPVRRDDSEVVEQKAASYRLFKKSLTRWRALHRRSEAVLVRIRGLLVEQYP